jgi:hypothetical protein
VKGGFRVRFYPSRQGESRNGRRVNAQDQGRSDSIISDVEGFRAYYVVYAPDDTVTAISIFNDYAGAEESNRRALAWIEQNLTPLLAGPATAIAGPVIVHTLA